MKTDTLDLLDQICDNAQFGKNMLGTLIKRSEDGSFRNALAEQFAQYHGIMEESQELSKKEQSPIQKKCKTPSGFDEYSARASLRLNLWLDKTSSHMAEMVMQGSVMNLIDLARGSRTFAGADEAAQELCKRFIALEEENVRRMVDYL